MADGRHRSDEEVPKTIWGVPLVIVREWQVITDIEVLAPCWVCNALTNTLEMWRCPRCQALHCRGCAGEFGSCVRCNLRERLAR